MGGFFTAKELKSKDRPDGKVLSCLTCGLYKYAKSPKMQPYGKGRKGIMIVGSYPNEVDDKNGKLYQKADGKYLKNTLAKIGIDVVKDCYSLNALNCHPTGKTTGFQTSCCRKIVMRHIETLKPKVIILLGDDALLSIVGGRWKRSLEGIQKWRGFTIPDQDLNTWVCPTFDPSFVLSKVDKNKAAEVIWIEDLKRAIYKAELPVPKFKEPEVIDISDNLDKLKVIKNYSTIAFDYETTGLKPHGKGHRIVCASVAVSPDKVYVFEMPKKAVERKAFVDLLKNKFIKKVAQNMKFEHSWSREILSTIVRNWHFDTMLATHYLDNRTGITSLKFQSYVQFGIADYDSEVAPYLKAKNEKNANSHNRLKAYFATPKGREKVLTYCGWDSALEYRLFELQNEIMNNPLPF